MFYWWLVCLFVLANAFHLKLWEENIGMRKIQSQEEVLVGGLCCWNSYVFYKKIYVYQIPAPLSPCRYFNMQIDQPLYFLSNFLCPCVNDDNPLVRVFFLCFITSFFYIFINIFFKKIPPPPPPYVGWHSFCWSSIWWQWLRCHWNCDWT